MNFNIKYFVAFIILLLSEIFIAIFVHDNIIRPYIGDVLVIIVLYTFIRSFTYKRKKHLPMYLFIFAVFIEVAQYFKLVELVNLQNNRILSIALGATFDIKDIACYFIGMLILIVFEIEKS